ncbi:MAG: archease [Armatimonadota bacterium]|nr:archease [Armatimonadota bacterium]
MESVDFEFVPHTADIAIRARARDLAGLARALALGLSAAALGWDTLQPYRAAGAVARPVSCGEAPDPEGLLVDFLNELLFQMDANAEVYTDVQVGQCDPSRGLTALAYPDPALRPTHGIKAATHHGVRLREERGGMELTVVFDV